MCICKFNLKMASCSLCLEIDVEVSMFEETDAFKHFQEILIKQGFEPLHSHSTVCFLCKHLINKYFSFLKRILRAQAVMRDVMKNRDSAKIPYTTLKKINRSDLNLSLNLSYHNLPSFYIGIKKEVDNETFQPEYEISPTDLDIKEEYDLNNEIELEKKAHNKDDKRSKHMKKNKANTRYKATPVDVVDDNGSNESEYEVNPADLETMTEESHIHYELVLEKKTENKENHEKSHNQKKKPKPKYKYKPMPVEIMPTKLRRKQTPKPLITEVTESDETENEETKQKPDDDEYIPDKLESESEEISENEICYNDNGKRMKKEDKRQYPMECEECNYDIPSALKHYHHYLVHHRDKEYPYKQPGQFVCQHCGVTKRNIRHLKNHEAVHGPRTIECDLCGKKFFTKHYMKCHRIIHSKNYSFICDYCNKGFHHKSELVLHIRVHTGEKPFKCHICGAGFAHKGNVGIHIRMSHQGIPMKMKTKKKSIKRKNIKKTSTKSNKKRRVRKSNKSDTSDSD